MKLPFQLKNYLLLPFVPYLFIGALISNTGSATPKNKVRGTWKPPESNSIIMPAGTLQGELEHLIEASAYFFQDINVQNLNCPAKQTAKIDSIPSLINVSQRISGIHWGIFVDQFIHIPGQYSRSIGISGNNHSNYVQLKEGIRQQGFTESLFMKSEPSKPSSNWVIINHLATTFASPDKELNFDVKRVGLAHEVLMSLGFKDNNYELSLALWLLKRIALFDALPQVKTALQFYLCQTLIAPGQPSQTTDPLFVVDGKGNGPGSGSASGTGGTGVGNGGSFEAIHFKVGLIYWVLSELQTSESGVVDFKTLPTNWPELILAAPVEAEPPSDSLMLPEIPLEDLTKLQIWKISSYWPWLVLLPNLNDHLDKARETSLKWILNRNSPDEK